MKLFSKSFGPLKIVHIGEKIHTGIGYRLGCGIDIQAESLSINWAGKPRLKIYTKLDTTYDIQHIKDKAVQ